MAVLRIILVDIILKAFHYLTDMKKKIITYSISMLRSSTAEENTPCWYNKTTLVLHRSKHSESD